MVKQLPAPGVLATLMVPLAIAEGAADQLLARAAQPVPFCLVDPQEAAVQVAGVEPGRGIVVQVPLWRYSFRYIMRYVPSRARFRRRQAIRDIFHIGWIHLPTTAR